MKARRKRSVSGHDIKKNPFIEFLKKYHRLFIIGVSGVAVVVIVMLAISVHPVQATVAVDDREIQASEPAPVASATEDPAVDPQETAYTTLQSGDENSQVQLLQVRLMDLGYMAFDEPNKNFGSGTEHAIDLFQRQHDMEQTGIADPVTIELLYSEQAKPYTLLEGTTGTDVDSLQRRLIDLGYMNKATGYYGTETIEAVKVFQDENGLYVDGKTGEMTLDLIYSPNALQSPMKATEAARRANILEMLDIAEEQLGKPYVWGAEGPNSFDCSGLVYYCLREAGSSRGRYNAAGYSQVSDWEKIKSMDNLEKGDLLFFSTNGKSVGHTGIYIGDGLMIDASSANDAVVERACKTGFWRSNFVVARRPW